MGKFVSKDNLSYFWGKMKTLLSGKADKSEIPDTSNFVTTNTAQTLYKKSFNQVTINVGTSNTASSTATKVVTLSNFELKTGAIIDVTFSNGSYYDTGSTTGLELSLNVNGTGAKKIMNYISSGAVVLYHSKNNYKKWNAGDTVRFRYDGTYWTLIANVTSMTTYLAPIFRFPLKYNKSDGTSTYWYGTENLDLTHLLPSTVQYVSQTLTDAEKTQARTNIGAGTSNFSGDYKDLSGKPTIPDVSNFITKDVNNLTNYTLSTGVGTKLGLSINTSTYVMTITLKNSSGTTLDTQTVDLPLESMVINASYNKSTKEITLTLQNGTTTSFSVADLVSGLVPNTRKVNGKALSSDITLTASDVGALPSSTTIPTVNNGKLTIKRNNTEVGSFTANQSGNTSINIEVPSLDGVVKTTGDETISGYKQFDDAMFISGKTSKEISSSSSKGLYVTGGAEDTRLVLNSKNYSNKIDFCASGIPYAGISFAQEYVSGETYAPYLNLYAIGGRIKINNKEVATTDMIPTVGTAASKGVVTTVDTSANLPTSNAVKTFVEGKGYVTSSGSVATATNATKLNNQDASYYLNYNNLSNKPTIPTVPTYYLHTVYLKGTDYRVILTIRNKSNTSFTLATVKTFLYNNGFNSTSAEANYYQATGTARNLSWSVVGISSNNTSSGSTFRILKSASDGADSPTVTFTEIVDKVIKEG